MEIVKRIAGVGFALLAAGILVIGLGSSGSDGNSQGVLDSPEASGRMLGTMIPVVFFGAIAVWLLFAKKPAK